MSKPSLSRLVGYSARDGLLLVCRRQWAVFLLILTALLTTAWPLSPYLTKQAEPLDMRFEVRRNVDVGLAHGFFALLQKLPGVTDSAFVTKEQAYEKARMLDPSLIAHIEANNQANPFPDTIALSLKDTAALMSLEELLMQPPWSTVLASNALVQIRSLQSSAEIPQRNSNVILLMGLIVFAIASLLGSFLHGREARREHRSKMLMGAEPFSMSLPPVIQMMALLCVASAATAGVSAGLLTLLT